MIAALRHSTDTEAQLPPYLDLGPIRFVTDERLDYNHFGPLQKSYVVASSYRSGSEYLCWKLWQTGLLGAPSEVLNPGGELSTLMTRVAASSPADYIAKLIARRASRNGVFGIKAHFHHFEAFLKEYPTLPEVLAPLTFIRLSRRDKVAQAVSMAKALQTDQWTSRAEEASLLQLRYDRETINRCLQEVEQQDLNWRRWFEAHDISPVEISYEELTADPAGVVRRIVQCLGVDNDEPDAVDVPPAEKQANEINQEWIERFRQEMRPLGNPGQANASTATAQGHFCERHARMIKALPARTFSTTVFVDPIELRRRYDAIFLHNRDLFQNARVLDLMSAEGFWSLAALDAGAAQIVGVERSQRLVAAAEQNFIEDEITPGSYRFIRLGIVAALRKFEPGSFDVVLCREFFEQCAYPEFFRQLSRLRPKHVVLDARLTRGVGPIARFAIATDDKRTIVSAPNHKLIALLCQDEFRWRVVDWTPLAATNWSGVRNYARGRTYVLDRVS